MARCVNISVCMATYNGERFVREQIESILAQLIQGDELIIVDDCSQDKTYDIITQIKWSGLKTFQNSANTGHVKTFERAIKLASNPYIFLSDQDDVWVDGRVEIMLGLLDTYGCDVLATQLVNFSSEIDLEARVDSWWKSAFPRGAYFTEIFKGVLGVGIPPRYGCAMAFKTSFRKIILPFPFFIAMHDVWIAICALFFDSYHFEDYISVYRRVHDKNVTSPVRRHLFLAVLGKINRCCQAVIAAKRLFKARMITSRILL